MLKKKRFSNVLLVVISSFLGGVISSLFLQPACVTAQTYRSLMGSDLHLFDSKGTRTADIFTPKNGGGILDLYAEDGTLRFQAGTYTAAGEKGLPLVGLSDNKSQLRMLLRLAGKNEAPVLIFKDKSGRDRIVMGLGMSGAGQEPFLSIVDKKGKKKNIFGTY